MEKINSVAQLKESIALLERKRSADEKLLRAEFKEVCVHLKPSNLIKTALKEYVLAPYVKDDSLNSTLGLAAGYLAKKVVGGAAAGPVKQILGTLIQMGVSQLVTKNADGIGASLKQLITRFLKKKAGGG